MPPWRELHSKSCYFSANLELLIFFLGKLFNSFPHVSKTSTAAMENSVEIS